jgi:hypothetical protein
MMPNPRSHNLQPTLSVTIGIDPLPQLGADREVIRSLVRCGFDFGTDMLFARFVKLLPIQKISLEVFKPLVDPPDLVSTKWRARTHGEVDGRMSSKDPAFHAQLVTLELGSIFEIRLESATHLFSQSKS